MSASGRDATARVRRATAYALLGLGERQFRRLEEQRVIRPAVPGSGRTPALYDVPALVADFLAYRLRQAEARTPRDQLALEQARLARVRYRRERGALLPRSEFVRRAQLLAAAVSAKVRALPTRLVRAGVVADVQEPTALAAVDELLQEIATWQTEQELRRAVEDGPDAA
jgi:hypothetical protein